jgi:hypothetical protein
MASVRVRFSPVFLSGAGFTPSKLLRRGSRTPGELLSISIEEKWSSESGEDCSGGVLETRWSTFLRGKPVFISTWLAVMILLSGKSCYSEKSRAKVHTDGNQFYCI